MASSLTANSLIINDTQEITGISNTLSSNANGLVSSKAIMDFLYEHGILKPWSAMTITLTNPNSGLAFRSISGNLYTDSDCTTLAAVNTNYTGTTFYYKSNETKPTGSYLYNYGDGTALGDDPSEDTITTYYNEGSLTACLGTSGYCWSGIESGAVFYRMIDLSNGSWSDGRYNNSYHRVREGKFQSVGGTIFYIDSTTDGTYTFYNASGEEVSAPTVGTDCTDWTYTVTGATKDKYYVYESATGLVISKYWGYYQITTSATGNSIGAGKTNTETVLSITDTSQYASGSIWEHIRNMRTNKTNGCDDWFVGCEDEYDQLFYHSETPAVSWFSSNLIWSSHEYDATNAYYWVPNRGDWRNNSKSYQWGLVPIRSF